MAGQRPKKGWIYKINPYRVSLRCKAGHNHIYDLTNPKESESENIEKYDSTEPGEVKCKTHSCSLIINSSHVFRGDHPYVIWASDEFETDTSYSVKTFTAIPLTSKTTFSGLPTTYPMVNNSKNGLDKKSYVLVHQLCTIDGNCFKKHNGDWLERMGQLQSKDRDKIEERLMYSLGLSGEPTDDWFRNNMTPELFKKAYGYLPEDLRMKALEDLLDGFE